VNETAAWVEQNQLALAAGVARVREALEHHCERERPEDGGRPAPATAATGSDSTPAEFAGSALAAVAERFALSGFESDVLALCAAVELDGAVPALCAKAHGDSARGHATFGLALAALDGAHWSALAPAGPLRRWELVTLGDGGVTRAAIRIDERVLHYLAGVDYLDERFASIVEPVTTRAALPPSQQQAAARVARHFEREAERSGAPVQLTGADPAAREAVAAAACESLACRLYALPVDAIPGAAADQDELLRLWQREVVLSGSALLVDAERLNSAEAGREPGVAWFVERLAGSVAISARDPLGSLRRGSVRIDVSPPSPDERRALWDAALAPAGVTLNGSTDQLVAQFEVDAAAIESAVAEAVDDAPGQASGAELGERLWDACRRQTRPRLDDLAQRIQPVAGWDDLVLPARQRAGLREMAAHVRHRSLVYERWGFARKSTRGLGIAALFSGASGTGKTMAAEVLAQELRLDLYRIDLSSVVSKYIGETEKNLRRVFDAAEGTGAVLLFDEADALFGKRTEVKDSHDRYANIEVSYLLQRVEAYRGLAILTTNLRNAIDAAFLRRIRFVVPFPFPEYDQRVAIWRGVFPADTPLDGIDPERLGRLNVTGGNIRNIGLNAAFLAADAGEPVRMTHLLTAARNEYAKLEQSLSEAETEGWE